MFQLSDAAMAPNHQVSLSPEIPESSEEAVAQTLDEPLKSSILSADATIPTQPPKASPSLKDLDLPYKWSNIFAISIFHMIATYGVFVLGTQAYWISIIWSESSSAVYNLMFCVFCSNFR